MSTTQWVITAAVSLIGGGAMGAFINNWLVSRRNKRQPIHYGIQHVDIIKQHHDFSGLQAVLTAGGGSGPGRAVNNLSVATFTLSNKGNEDLERFDFGLTLEGTSKAIDVKFENPDRHHKVELLTPVSLLEPKQEIDFAVRPFHRGDVYNVSIVYTYEDKPGGLNISTPQSQRLVRVNPWEITPSYDAVILKWAIRVTMTSMVVGSLLLLIFIIIYLVH